MADDYSSWKLVPATPAPATTTAPVDVSGWKLQPVAPTVQAPGAIESLARGAAQGGTFGFADELEGALPAGLQGIYNLGRKFGISTPLGETDAEGKPVGAGDVYREFRDSERAKNQAAVQSHPGMYLTGALTTGIGTGRLLPFVGGKAPLAAKVAAQALYSGLSSAGASNADSTTGVLKDASGISGVEDTAHDIGDGQVRKALLDALGSGAISGGALAAVAPTLTRGIGSRLREGGIDQGRRALYNITQSLSARKEIPAEAVQTVLESGAMPAGASAKTIATKLVDAADRSGANLGGILERAGNSGVTVPVAPIYNELASRAVQEMPLHLTETVPNIYKRAALGIMDRLGVGDDATADIRNVEALKRDAQETATSAYKQFQPSSVGQANMGIASVLRQASEDALQRASESAPPSSELASLADEFVPAKRQFGNLAQARDLAIVGKARGLSRTSGGLVGEEIAAEGLKQIINGNPVDGLKEFALKNAYQMWKSRSPSALANALYFGGKAMSSPNTSPVAQALMLGGQRGLEAANPPPVRVRVIDPATGKVLGGDY